jgi:deazaflavin-dependent oxidoreductase (nitroreductase family)
MGGGAGLMAIRGNALVLAVLRSRAHRLLSGLAIELRYVGRRSGRAYAVPVQYAREGRRLVVVPQNAAAATWWRNFRSPRPVQVRLRGRMRAADARVISPDDPTWDRHRALYTARWRLAARPDGPLVVITLDEPD